MILDKIKDIKPTSVAVRENAKEAFDLVAMPLDSLGLLQETVIDMAAIFEGEKIDISKRAVAVFCADNGVVAQGISQVDSSRTAQVAYEIANKRTVMCTMARHVKADVFCADIGMLTKLDNCDIIDLSIAEGTKDFTVHAAMSKDQALLAMERGFDLACDLHSQGYNLLIAGEMGIGNTTTSAAMACAMLKLSPELVAGAGAGLSPEGIARKAQVIGRGIKLHNPDPNDAIEVLSTLGGFDIAGMAGFMLGCAYSKIPCVLDGIIAGVAAMVAVSLAPASSDYLFASHESREPVAAQILKNLQKDAVIHAKLKLGEGSGAVCVLPLLDIAIDVFYNGPSFAKMNMEAYKPL